MFVIYNNKTHAFVGTGLNGCIDEDSSATLMDAYIFKTREEAEKVRNAILNKPCWHPTFSILQWM